MSYQTAKTQFEAVVKSMQADLQRYIDSGKANQRAVDIKTDQINKMVEYYQQAEEMISEKEMESMELSIKYGTLHADTTKLVIFTKLHGINPNLVFHYTLVELNDLQRRGLLMIPPQSNFLNVKVVMITDYLGFDKPEIELEQRITDTKSTNKYQHLNATCK